VHLASDEFLRQLRDLTERRRLLLIFDEIQTGMGRTGTLFGYEQTGVVPDVMTLGKGLGGGLPIAALVATEEVCCFEAGDQGGTFNGNPLVCAAGVAVLQELTRPGFLANTKASGQYLQDRLRQLSARHGQGEVRGRGLLLALALKGLSGPRVVEAAAAAGLLINSPREDTLRFLPALNVSVAEIDTAMTILDDVFEALRRSC
jgi:acetylornithine/N-succinyldiaminopimelate aminotransferase